MPYLIIREPDRVAFSVPLKDTFRIGRSLENDLVLNDRHVSRQHLELSIRDGECLAVDLGSRHGTMINGARAERCKLRPEDRIQIGKVVLTYCEDLDQPQILHQVPSTVETIAPFVEDPVARRLRLFYDLGRALTEIGDTEAMLKGVLQAVAEVLGCRRALIGILEDRQRALRKIAWCKGQDGPGELVMSEAALEALLHRREAVILRSGPAGQHRSGIGAPLQLGTRLLGFIWVQDSVTNTFAPEDLHFLSALASLAAAAIESAERFQQATAAAEALREPAEEMLGESEPIIRLKSQIDKYAAAPSANVLIQGESGTGKELVARLLHARSPRSAHPFVAVNCAALPETMIESELFGYEKGAFTGAAKGKRGKFQLAHRGTLFLDEIGDLSLAAQAKVLRVIEDGEIQPLGSEKVGQVDVRILSATNKDLMKEVEARRFREDLYYRLTTLQLELEPLRSRSEDIALLAQAFLARAGARLGKHFTGFTERALDALRAYSWAGNIRELRNEIERAAILSPSVLIDASDLSPRLTAPGARAPISLSEQFARLNDTERGLVEGAMARAKGNVSEAARLLGISRIMMKRRVDRYELRDEQTL